MYLVTDLARTCSQNQCLMRALKDCGDYLFETGFGARRKYHSSLYGGVSDFTRTQLHESHYPLGKKGRGFWVWTRFG